MKQKKKKPARMDIAVRKKNYVQAAHTQVKILQSPRFGNHSWSSSKAMN